MPRYFFHKKSGNSSHDHHRSSMYPNGDWVRRMRLWPFSGLCIAVKFQACALSSNLQQGHYFWWRLLRHRGWQRALKFRAFEKGRGIWFSSRFAITYSVSKLESPFGRVFPQIQFQRYINITPKLFSNKVLLFEIVKVWFFPRIL